MLTRESKWKAKASDVHIHDSGDDDDDDKLHFNVIFHFFPFQIVLWSTSVTTSTASTAMRAGL